MSWNARWVALAWMASVACGGAHSEVCGAPVANVVLHALDATTSVALPFVVTVNGAAPEFYTCSTESSDVDVKPDQPCAGDVSFFLIGKGTIEVTSSGYVSTKLELDGGKPDQQCAQPPYSFDLALELTKS
jgi:hypothetical protein